MSLVCCLLYFRWLGNWHSFVSWDEEGLRIFRMIRRRRRVCINKMVRLSRYFSISKWINWCLNSDCEHFNFPKIGSSGGEQTKHKTTFNGGESKGQMRFLNNVEPRWTRLLRSDVNMFEQWTNAEIEIWDSLQLKLSANFDSIHFELRRRRRLFAERAPKYQTTWFKYFFSFSQYYS